MRPEGARLHRFLLVGPDGDFWFDSVTEAFKARDASRTSGRFTVYVSLEGSSSRFVVLRP
jgi:hypothetical protein